MIHIDLFSGIGGFSLAVDNVWPNAEHVFCETNPFCKAILKKHWPTSKIYDDIRTIADATDGGCGEGVSVAVEEGRKEEPKPARELEGRLERPFILTGGFSCQPFSQSGRRRGTEDDRYLWPPMLAVIKKFRPKWVIAENVGGILTWDGGLVFETVCADLEAEGYSVQAFVIPACSVGAPHRRDRVWFVAHDTSNTSDTGLQGGELSRTPGESTRTPRPASERDSHEHVADSKGKRVRGVASEECRDAEWKVEQKEQVGSTIRGEGEGCSSSSITDSDTGRIRRYKREGIEEGTTPRGSFGWSEDWPEVAAELCTLDDGVSSGLVGTHKGDRGGYRVITNSEEKTLLTEAKWRIEALKACGNAIVPQVAIEIMRRIKSID
jgi:DNA (cytosine-5)-methyltransferase 1